MPLKRNYDNYLNSWDACHSSDNYLNSKIDDNFIFFFSEYIKLNNSYPVLDYGCGNGSHISFLKDHQINISGCDISDIGINKKSSNVSDYFKTCDGMHVPFSNELFSHAYSINCIDFMSWENANAVIPEIYRVLIPNGYLYLDIASDGHIIKDEMSFIESKEVKILDDIHVQACHFSRLKITRLLDPLFKIISCELKPGYDLITSTSIKRWHVICQKIG